MATVQYTITADATGLQQVIQETSAEFNAAGQNAETLQDRIDSLSQEIEDAGGTVAITSQTISDLGDIAGDAGIATQSFSDNAGTLDDQLSNLSAVTQRVNEETGQTQISLSNAGQSAQTMSVDVSALYDESEQLVISQQNLSQVNNELSTNLGTTTNELNKQSAAKGESTVNTRDYTQATGMAVNENGRLIPILQQSNGEFNRKNRVLRASTVATGAAATATGSLSGASGVATGAMVGQASAATNAASSIAALRAEIAQNLDVLEQSAIFTTALNEVTKVLSDSFENLKGRFDDNSQAYGEIIDRFESLMVSGTGFYETLGIIRDEFVDSQTATEGTLDAYRVFEGAIDEIQGGVENFAEDLTTNQQSFIAIEQASNKAGLSVEEYTKKVREGKDPLKDLEKGLSSAKGGADGSKDSFAALDGVLELLPSSLMAIVKGAKATAASLLGIVAANPILAAVSGAIIAIRWAVKDLQPVIDFFANRWIEIGTTIDMVKGVLQGATSVFDLFNGTLTQNIDALQDLRIELRNLDRDLNLSTAILNKELQASLVTYRDINNSLADRQTALERAGTLQDEMIDLEEEILAVKIREMAIQNTLNDTNEEGQKEYNDLVAEFIQLQARRERQDFQLIRRQNRLTREQRQQNEEAKTLLEELRSTQRTAHQNRLNEFKTEQERIKELHESGVLSGDEYYEALRLLHAERDAYIQQSHEEEMAAVRERLSTIQDSLKTEEEKITETYESRKESVQNALEAGIVSEREANRIAMALQQQYFADLEDLEKDTTEETQQFNLQTIAGMEAEIAELRAKHREADTQAERDAISQQIENYELELEAFRTTEEEKAAIEEANRQRRREANRREAAQNIQSSLRVMQAVQGFFNQMDQNRINAIERETQKRLDAAAARGATEEELQQIEENGQEKINKIKTEQAKKEKAWALSQVAIETALAVLRAAPNPFRVAAVIALGAVQAATIASQPVPEFRDGGFIEGAGNGRSDSINARLSNGEFVVNAESTRRNRALLENINSTGSATMPQQQTVNVVLDLDDVIQRIDDRKDINKVRTIQTN